MTITPESPFYFAKTVNQAVLVAEQLKKQGDYDLFRGQIQNFPVQPSIFRSGIDRAIAIERLNKLGAWVHKTAELRSLHSNSDAILAVAQHYGLKTTFLDFTTNPRTAGFFAADGIFPNATTWEPQGSCIICVNRRVLRESWQDINKRSKADGQGELVRLVEIDVSNLWRLQAQEGLFVDVRVDPVFFEMFSSLFRIMFPYRGAFRSVRREAIYPTRKSHLELLLEEYFSYENFQAGIAKLERMGFARIEVDRGPFFGEPTAFKSGEIPPILTSWKNEKLMAWREEPNEYHKDVQCRNSIRIVFKAGENVGESCSRIRKQIRRALKRNPHLRKI